MGEQQSSSPLWPWPSEPQSSPRRVSPLLWPEVVARLLEELRLPQESSPTRLCSSVEVLVDLSCAEDLLLPRTWLLPLVTAVVGNPLAGWESVWATTTSMKMILIRWTLLSRLSCSMKTMTPGPSTMTSVFWRLTAWLTSAAPTSGPSACHLTEMSTQQELTAPCLDGEPPRRAAAWARS